MLKSIYYKYEVVDMGKKNKALGKMVKNIGKHTKADKVIKNVLKKIDELSDEIEEEINNFSFNNLFRWFK